MHAVKFRGKSGQPIVIPKEEVILMNLANISLNTSMDANNSSHCSKVHAVKFRGKSRQPIVIPKENLANISLNTSMDANNSKDEKEEEDEPQKENRAKDLDNCQCGDPLDYMCHECIYKRWKVEYDLVRIPIIINID